jgi:microcin C transport system substrate-binding protein
MKNSCFLLSLLVLLMILSGCGLQDTAQESTRAATSGGMVEDQFKPSYGERDPIALANTIAGGTFTTWGGSFPKSLNMFLDYNRFSATVLGLLYEPLLSLHSTDNKPVGVLAESWEIAEDEMTFTFKIR